MEYKKLPESIAVFQLQSAFDIVDSLRKHPSVSPTSALYAFISSACSSLTSAFEHTDELVDY